MFPDLTGPKLLVTKKTATLKVLTKINLRQKNGLDSTPPNSEMICGQNVGTKVVYGIIFFFLKKTMLKV